MTAKNIHEAILEVMKQVAYIQKEKKQGMNFSVKTEQAVMEVYRQPMIDNDIIMFPCHHPSFLHTEFEQDTKYGTKKYQRTMVDRVFRFVHVPSGTFAEVASLGVGIDTGDKDANGAMTVAKKYAILETFFTITGDDPDTKPSPSGEKESWNIAKDLSDAPVSPNVEKKVNRPYSPEVVKEKVKQFADKLALGNQGLESNDGQVVASILNAILTDDTKRYELCKWLVDEASTKKMSAPVILAMKQWLGVKFYGDVPEQYVIDEVNAVHKYALTQSGQTELGV